ncbi:MAG TPA: MFS transporter, partial [Candidatus Dormibacteraeota bacterium]|nr:MFS transporter [Candidatus Dormibacteraeota bacterium]
PFVAFGAIYQRQLGASALEIGLLAAVAMVVATLVMIPGTRLAERYSLRKTIIAGWIIAIPAPVLFAVAPHWAWTAVGMVFLQASVINTPAISVYLTLGVPRDRIAMVMTTVMSAYSIGLIASSLLTGWLAQVAPLFALFWFSFAFYCLAAVCIAFLPAKERSRAASAGLRYRDLMRYPAYTVLLGLFTVVTVIIFLPWTFTALYARDFGHVNNLWIGILMACLYLGSVFLGLSLGGLRRTLGSVVIVLAFEAAYVLSAILLFSSGALPLLVAAFFLRGAFWSFRHVMTGVIGEVLPDAAMAKGYGLFALVTGAAAALAYPVGGWMYGMQAVMPFWSSALLMAAAMVVTLVVRSYFHANYLKPVEIETERDQALPLAA